MVLMTEYMAHAIDSVVQTFEDLKSGNYTPPVTMQRINMNR